MKRRIEPEPALGRKVRFHFHVGDQEPVFERDAFAVESHQIANRTTRAIGGDHIAAAQSVLTVGRVDGQRHGCVARSRRSALLHTDHFAFPANLDVRHLLRAFEQKAFDVILLQVDERGPMVARFRLQIERIDEFVFEEHLADIPADALVHHSLTASEAIENIERALREADRA